MTKDLTDRYIYAVTKRLPKDTREDVAEELRSLIEDMLAERCGEVQPTEKDLRVVLTELGTPEELYEKYDADSRKCLIGAPYYTTYQLVLKIVLLCVTFGMTISCFLIQLTSPDAVWYETVLQWFAMLWSGLISGFACVTLIFAVFYQKDIHFEKSFDLNDLPPVPDKKQRLSKKECIFKIVMTILFLVVLLAAPQILGAVVKSPAGIIPVFRVEVIRGTWYSVTLFAVMGLVREIVKLLEGHYNKKVMLTSVATNIAAAAAAFWWLCNDRIMNPEFASAISEIFAGDESFIVKSFANFQYFFLGVILFALVLDTAVTVRKSLS